MLLIIVFVCYIVIRDHLKKYVAVSICVIIVVPKTMDPLKFFKQSSAVVCITAASVGFQLGVVGVPNLLCGVPRWLSSNYFSQCLTITRCVMQQYNTLHTFAQQGPQALTLSFIDCVPVPAPTAAHSISKTTHYTMDLLHDNTTLLTTPL